MSIRIVWVDDDPLAQSGFVIELQMRDIDVDFMPDADRFLNVVRSGKQVDLFIIDLMILPPKDISLIDTQGAMQTGIFLAKEARYYYPTTPILMYTQAPERRVKDAIELGKAIPQVSYASKKRDIDSFLEEISDVLGENLAMRSMNNSSKLATKDASPNITEESSQANSSDVTHDLTVKTLQQHSNPSDGNFDNNISSSYSSGPSDSDSSISLLKKLAKWPVVISLFVIITGIIFTLLPSDSSTEVKIGSWAITTRHAGVAALFLGVSTFLLSFRQIISVLKSLKDDENG